MRIYYRENQAPNFYIAFEGHRDDDVEEPLNVPSLQNPAQGDRIIRRGNQAIGYKLGATNDHVNYITAHIIQWSRTHAHWHGSDKNDLEALKLLKEWCVWLVTIETAVIGALAVFSKDVVLWWEPGYSWGRGLAAGIVLTLGFSIFWAIHMLLALPAIAQKFPPPEPNQDIYSVLSTGTLKLRLSTYVTLMRWSSLIGFILFIVLTGGIVICQMMPAPDK
jgi:hypothetical protein